MTPAARIASAIDLLSAIEAAGQRPADAVASTFFRERRYIGSADRRAIAELAWGGLRAWRRIGWWIERARAAPTPRLRVAALLLLQGGSLEGLERAFSGGQFAAEALSAEEKAVLRTLVGRTKLHPGMPEAVRYEVPDWLVDRLRARFGPALEAEMAAMEAEAPLDLRVNSLRGTREEALASLAAEGLEAEPTRFSPWGLRLPGRRAVMGGAAFRSGLVEIQDEGSQLVAALVGAAPGMRVVDWCAGAGGKTLALAMAMQNRGHIVACDVHEGRLEAAVARLRRAGVHNVERHVLVAGDKWRKRRAASFDRVLVDAPCTGSGTWRRNPDARRHLTEAGLGELRAKQAAILSEAAGMVRPGGRLVYATCSLLREENEEPVERMLAEHPDFAVLPLAEAWDLPGPLPNPGPYLSLSPRQHGTDGFFAAVLVRGGAP